MISGVAAIVLRPVTQVDRLGNEVATAWEPEEVPGVLVAPVATSDIGATRPDGKAASLTLHFPKTYAASLEGCRVELPAPWDVPGGWRVVGSPAPYMDWNTPGRWNRPVEVEAAHG